MNIIILGDKFQKRMKSKGCVGLIRVNKLNILQHQVRYLREAFGDCNIVYVYGFDNKKFLSYLNKNNDFQKNNFIPIYNELYNRYNNGYSLSLAKDYLDDDCLILFGDNIIGNRVLAKFKTNGSQIFVAPNIKNRLGCVLVDNKIENISFDLDNYLYEIYYLSKDHSLLLKQLLQYSKYYNHFVFELINKLITNHCDIKPFILNKKFHHEKSNSYL